MNIFEHLNYSPTPTDLYFFPQIKEYRSKKCNTHGVKEEIDRWLISVREHLLDYKN